MGGVLGNKRLTADYVTVTLGRKETISLRDYFALMIN